MKRRKKRCKFYYQELALSDAEKINYSEIVKDDKIYKYICVKDIKDLDYYSEELVFSGTPCQGVVIYEIDKKSNMKSDAYSYVKCDDAYRTQEKNVKIEELFKNCFDGSTATDREETYTVTVKHVENDLGGMEISPRKTYTVKESKLIDDKDDVLFSIDTILHTRNGNTYSAVLNKGGKNIDYNKRTVNNKTVFDITGLPTENITINIVYSVEKHAIVSNFYRFVPGKSSSEKSHNNVKMDGINEQKISGYTFETMRIEYPETLNQTVNGKNEKYNLVEVWVDNDKKTLPFDGAVDIGQVDKKVDFVYQQEEFNVTYNNKGGSGCDSGRVKYNKKWNLCTPTRVGYTFDGWSLTDGGEKINDSEINTYYRDLTLYARWNVNNYKIQYVLNDGTVSTSGPSSVAYDQVFNLANPTKEAYTFTGWTVSGANASTAKHGTSSTNVNSAISNSTTKIKSTYFKNLTSTNNATVTMTANYEINTYNISFDCNGGTGSTAAMNNISYGSTVNLSANGCSRTGYNFGGWSGSNGKTYTDKQSVNNLSSLSGETIIMKAIWNVKTFTITYDLSDGVKGASAPTSGAYNSTVTVSNPSRPGWTFTGWTVTGTGASISGTSLKIGNSNVTLKANFRTHILTYIDYMWNNARSANSLTNADPASNKRFTGSNPNNYVKFNDESWRMIGVFNVSSANRVKIIRDSALYVGSYDVSSSSVLGGYGVNDWTQSDTRTILNGAYLNDSTMKYCTNADVGISSVSSCSGKYTGKKLSVAAQNMISSVTWNTGAIHFGATHNQTVYNNISKASAYNAERSSATGKQCTNSRWEYCKNDSVPRYTTWSGKIGLPYPSDWGYASSNSNCNNLTNTSACSSNNWMNKGEMWTLTPSAWWNMDNCNSIIYDNELYAHWQHVHGGIFPTAYLNTNLYFVAGTGTASNPYVISE